MKKSLVLRSANDVRRDILAHQALGGEPGSPRDQRRRVFLQFWNAMGVGNHTRSVFAEGVLEGV
ncbi:hypothetical protein [Pseudomonas sp. CFBP13509]|uniref:hypothetical protein n=1 Tax=Pseudomonas sp. CFBP13509 TaxID=2184008 RepID=UPI0010BFDBBD|nr:hypothetical protein [Pseudomonas sp. CFBP13509]